MPKIKYQEINFRKKSEARIQQANKIIREYAAEGFNLTLRQLYYQFVARGLLDNKMTEYKKLGSLINDARLAGRIDWNAIEDRTRNLRIFPHWENPAEILEESHYRYAEDLWATQPYYIEAWIEKDALIGVLESASRKHRLPHFSCRGYVSQSEMWTTAQRLIDKVVEGKKVLILHLGDHDPSGMDMSRDIFDRLEMFMNAEGLDGPEVDRLALNMAQVRKYDPPPNPAKLTDSRASEYIDKFGNESWELDALDPRTISGLVHAATEKRLDYDAWEEALGQESDSKAVLRGLIDSLNGDDEDETDTE